MNAQQKEEFEAEWKKMDLNGDGSIDKAEVQTFFRAILTDLMKSFGAPQDQIEAALEKAWEGFLKMDSNNDGKISKEEMIEYCEKHGSIPM